MIKISNTLERLYVNEIKNYLTYTNFATRFKAMGLNNFSAFFTKQAEEEKVHSEKFRDFLVDMGYTPQYSEISNIPDYSQASVLEMAQEFVYLEQKTTHGIEEGSFEAMENKDLLSLDLLRWFLQEQVEELGKSKDFLDKIKMLGSSGNLASICLYDSEIEVD